ncbi:hypothetical protein BJ912DRAFT_41472 [Pholiota molesta]|nr:hypothetical protein BJ912DRAFT_41472 [Pholiota molesta]
MAGPSLSVIIDDSRTDSFVFGPLEWTRTTLPEWFNSTSQSPTFALNPGSQLGTVQMKFDGTSVAFFGNTPPSSGASQTFSVSIDGSAPYNTTYADPNPPMYRQWYQSPMLEEGTHSIAITNIAGASVDYAVVTVGNDTSLSGTLVIGDNDDPGFNYTGQWRRNQEPFNSGPQPDGNPFHNTTHQTSSVGSFLTYQFSGTSAAVYGIFTWFNLGLIELAFTLDDETLSQTYRVDAESPQFVSELGQQQNFLFYSYDVLPAGDHTLIVNLTACVNQTLAFDYVTYTPSFATLASMPNLTLADPTSTQTTMSKNSHLGIIAAGLGGAIILLLLGGIIFLCRRRRRKEKRFTLALPFKQDRPWIQHIPLLSPPSTASRYNSGGTMACLQSTGGAEYRLLPRQTDEALAPLQPVRRLPSPSNSVGNDGADTGAPHVSTSRDGGACDAERRSAVRISPSRLGNCRSKPKRTQRASGSVQRMGRWKRRRRDVSTAV